MKTCSQTDPLWTGQDRTLLYAIYMRNEDRVRGGVNVSVGHVHTTPTSLQIHTPTHTGVNCGEQKLRETEPLGKSTGVPSTQTPTFIPPAET